MRECVLCNCGVSGSDGVDAFTHAGSPERDEHVCIIYTMPKVYMNIYAHFCRGLGSAKEEFHLGGGIGGWMRNDYFGTHFKPVSITRHSTFPPYDLY